MANRQLIATAAQIAQADGFNKGWAEGAANIEKWAGKAEEEIKLRREEKEKADARIGKFMDKFGAGSSLPKVPESAQSKLTTFLTNHRNKYSDLANSTKDFDPKDMEYQDSVRGMNDIMRSFERANNQFEVLSEMKLDYMDAVDKGSLSYGFNPKDRKFWDAVVQDEAEIDIDETGEIFFTVDGEKKKLEELPEVIEHDPDTEEKLWKLAINRSNKGMVMSEEEAKYVRKQVEDVVQRGGRNAVVTLAADSSIGMGNMGLAVGNDLLFDPERRDELKDLVVNSWMEVIKRAANEGKRRKDVEMEADLQTRSKYKTQRAPREDYWLDEYIYDYEND